MQSLSAALLGVYLLSATPFLAPLSPRSSSSSAARSSSSFTSTSSRSSLRPTSSSTSSRRALPVLTAPTRTGRSSSAAIPARSSAQSSVSSVPALAASKVRLDVLALVNNERAAMGLPPLKQNTLLENAAQTHATDMRTKRYVSHTSLDGREPGTRIRATGYLTVNCASCNYSTTTGENIGYGQPNAATIVAEWMKSPLHRGNILDKQFKDAGVGFDAGYWVINFGSVTIR